MTFVVVSLLNEQEFHLKGTNIVVSAPTGDMTTNFQDLPNDAADRRSIVALKGNDSVNPLIRCHIYPSRAVTLWVQKRSRADLILRDLYGLVFGKSYV